MNSFLQTLQASLTGSQEQSGKTWSITETETAILTNQELEQQVASHIWRNRGLRSYNGFNTELNPGILRRKIVTQQKGKQREVWSPEDPDYIQQVYFVKGVINPLNDAKVGGSSHAFRRGYSTCTALNEAARAIRKRAGSNVLVSQVDIADCFATLPTEIAGVLLPDATWEYTRKLQRRFRETASAGHRSPPGLPAGAPMAPGIANLVIDHVLKGFRDRWREDADVIVYADDITVVSAGRHAREILRQLEQELNRHGMELNQRKTRSMYPTAGNRLTLLGFEIEWETAEARPTIGPKPSAYAALRDKLVEATDLAHMRAIVKGWNGYFRDSNHPQFVSRRKLAVEEGFMRAQCRTHPGTTTPREGEKFRKACRPRGGSAAATD